MDCRLVPFVYGRRPTDEDDHPGLGSSDCAAFVTGEERDNRTILLFDLADIPAGARVDATVAVDEKPLPGWHERDLVVTGEGRHRLVLDSETDLAEVDLGLPAGFMRRVEVLVRVVDGEDTAYDEASFDLCDLRNMGSLYVRILDRIVTPDTTRQAKKAGVPDPGPAYHPWYPVLTIGGEKAALYTDALVLDVVEKQCHLTDPAWLMRVGVYLELLTCIGIAEAVRDDIGDLLEPAEREAYESSEVFAPIRDHINVDGWRDVWKMRRIVFPGFGSPRLGAVSGLNLLHKKDATLRFLHVHHEDLKHAIELAGPNLFSSQETWQRVFRDAERAVMRKVGDAFPELGYLPGPARDLILWQRLGAIGQEGLYPTACNQYRASMNYVADWAKQQGLMDHAGAECIPLEVSLLHAMTHDKTRVAALQRQDGLGPDVTVCEPAVAAEPTVDEIEALLADVPIFSMMSTDELHELALGARPLLLGHTQRFVVEGHKGTSLFLVGDGQVEVRRRNAEGGDDLVDVMSRGEVVGEMALLSGTPRSATVRSVDESVVYEISRQLYEPIVQHHPEWLEQLAAIMEERLARRSAGSDSHGAPASSGSILDNLRRSFIG